MISCGLILNDDVIVHIHVTNCVLIKNVSFFASQLFLFLGITHSLNLTEQTRENLEDEIRILNREKGELTEQLGIVSNLISSQ